MDDKDLYRIASRRAGAKLGFYIHLMVFVVVNGILVAANLIFSPGSLWFPFPLLGWGLGLLIHGFTVFVVTGSNLKQKMIDREMNRIRPQ